MLLFIEGLEPSQPQCRYRELEGRKAEKKEQVKNEGKKKRQTKRGICREKERTIGRGIMEGRETAATKQTTGRKGGRKKAGMKTNT